MTQPDYVPILDADRVRPTDRLPVPEPWVADRVAEISALAQPSGAMFGTNGPDQGYAMMLAERLADRLVLAPGESRDDALAGVATTALRRAAHFGRAPVIYDLEWAIELWGLTGDAPADLVAARTELFGACAHHYLDRRAIAARVTKEALSFSPNQVRAVVASGEWATLLASNPG